MSTRKIIVMSLNRIIFIVTSLRTSNPVCRIFFAMAPKASYAIICGICGEHMRNVAIFSLRHVPVCFIHIYLLVADTIGSVFR